MDFMKFILLLSISIACSLSQQLEDTQAEYEIDWKVNSLSNREGNCNGKSCGVNLGLVNTAQKCTCHPLNYDNMPVPEYLINDGQTELSRTVLYVYKVGNVSTIYMPNLEKQALYPDLTFDDGDILRPLSSQHLKLLTEYEPTQVKNDGHIRRTNALENVYINHPTITQSSERFDLPSKSEDLNTDVLKQVLEDDLNVLVPNELPSANQDLGQLEVGEPYSVYNIYDNQYAEKPQQVFVSKPGNKNKHVHETIEPQKDVNIYHNDKIDMHQITEEPIVFESSENDFESIISDNNQYNEQSHAESQEDAEISSIAANNNKNYVSNHNIAGSKFENSELKPIEDIYFPLKDFGFNQDQYQLYGNPHKVFELNPITQDKQDYNIDRHLVDPSLKPSMNELNSYSFVDHPSQGIESKPSEKDIDPNKIVLPLHQQVEPQTLSEFNSNDNNILVDKSQATSGIRPNKKKLYPLVEPPKVFGLSSPSNIIKLPNLVNKLRPKPNDKNSHLNHVVKPHIDIESEIKGGDLISPHLLHRHSNTRCGSGVCKLYIYCSRKDCPKYLQSLAKLHTSIHKHPYLENTFVAIKNVRATGNKSDSYIKPIINLIGLEDVGESMQNIRSDQSEDNNPDLKYVNLLGQQVPISIPNYFQPLSSILDQGRTIPKLLSPSQIKQRQAEYYPINSQILSTPYRSPPYYKDNNYLPKPVDDRYYRSNALAPESNGNILKDLFLLPSKLHHNGMKTVADLIPNLTLRSDLEDEEREEVPVDEDDIKIKIIGGQAATSSGTPVKIKARLSDV